MSKEDRLKSHFRKKHEKSTFNDTMMFPFLKENRTYLYGFILGLIVLGVIIFMVISNQNQKLLGPREISSSDTVDRSGITLIATSSERAQTSLNGVLDKVVSKEEITHQDIQKLSNDFNAFYSENPVQANAMIGQTYESYSGDNPETIQAGGLSTCAQLNDFDLDDDNIIGITDFLLMLAAWGPNPGNPADYDQDGEVGITDFLLLLANWGTFDCMIEVCDGNDGTITLDQVRDDLIENYIQVCDIDLTGLNWEPIGEENESFVGIYDGDNFIISNLFIDRPDEGAVGLFGASRGNIRNVSLINVNIIGKNGVGSLVGLLTVVYDGDSISFQGIIQNSFAESVYISGLNGIGGLVGVIFDGGTLTKTSTTNGTIESTGNDVGGLVGLNFQGDIENSYSNVNVYGNNNVGGLLGTSGNSLFALTNTYHTIGIVQGVTNIGGLVGSNEFGNFNSSYWNTETSNIIIGCGNVGPDDPCNGIYGKTTDDMTSVPRPVNIYVNWSFTNETDLNSSDIWSQQDGDYPIFGKWHSCDITDLNGDGQTDILDFGLLDDYFILYGGVCATEDCPDFNGDGLVDGLDGDILLYCIDHDTFLL